jgi:D-3-phosphoglycerate dehydrogenase
MAANTKRVFYVKYVAHTVFNDILEARPDVRLDRLDNDSPAAEVAPVLEAAHAFQIGASRDELAPQFFAHPEFLARCPNLLLVSSNGAGYDTIDVDACTAAGVLAVNQAGGNAEAVATHALALLLNLTKRIGEIDRAMRRELVFDRAAYIGRNPLEKTIGIIGMGHVGTRLAELVRAMYRMRVLAYDPYLTAEQIAARGGEKTDLDTLCAQSDYVSVNCPRTKETLGMVGAAQFAQMKPTAYFITTARGGIHDEAALAEALAAGKLAGAGLDVWAKEPPPLDHPLLAMDNVVVSQHTAGVTRESRENMGRIAAQQILDVLDGKPATRILNPEVWPAFAARFEKIFGFAPTR